jgi:hypothetical protein
MTVSLPSKVKVSEGDTYCSFVLYTKNGECYVSMARSARLELGRGGG